MPRQSRLDAPGLLQHVMARGIERRDIFKDDKDRKAILDRLAIILEETQTQCYAWSLIPNHFHLLLRTGSTPLSKVMRRLMTGYAVYFNKRHKRSGHLFQNRYKSIVCEENTYLLELIRYIHLNPLRSGLVKDQRELDKYLWSGHSVILGHCKNPLVTEVSHPFSTSCSPARLQGLICFDSDPSSRIRTNQQTSLLTSFAPSRFNDKPLAEKTIEDVLLHFGDTLKIARRRYRDFVKKGVDQGSRPEFQGGGLVRSAGGDKRVLLGRKKEERAKGDVRILGSGDFVNETLQKAEVRFEKKYLQKRPIEELVEKVASHLDLNPKGIISDSRRKEITEARALICHLAIYNFNYSASEVARSLSISRVNAGRCAERGKNIIDNYQNLRHVFT